MRYGGNVIVGSNPTLSVEAHCTIFTYCDSASLLQRCSIQQISGSWLTVAAVYEPVL